MKEISFNELSEAVTELTRKVDELTRKVDEIYNVIKNLQPQDPAEQYLSVDETAKFLNLSVPTIYSKVARRELPYMKRGKRLYFARKDLETYLQGGRVKTVRELEIYKVK